MKTNSIFYRRESIYRHVIQDDCVLCFLIQPTTDIHTDKSGIKYAALVTAESLTEGSSHSPAIARNLTAHIKRDILSLCCVKEVRDPKCESGYHTCSFIGQNLLFQTMHQRLLPPPALALQSSELWEEQCKLIVSLSTKVNSQPAVLKKYKQCR